MTHAFRWAEDIHMYALQVAGGGHASENNFGVCCEVILVLFVERLHTVVVYKYVHYIPWYVYIMYVHGIQEPPAMFVVVCVEICSHVLAYSCYGV